MAGLSDITLGRYVQGRSRVHRLDPRTKIVCAVILMVSLLGSHSAISLCCTMGLIVAFTRLAGLPTGNLKPVAPLLLLTVCLHAWVTPGQIIAVVPWGLGELTRQGLMEGIYLATRFAAFVLGTALLTLTTSPLELADGLESILGPLRRFRFPVHEFAMTITIALRFVPILIDEADRLKKAQAARGADFGGGPIKRVRSLLPLLMPLFVSAFTRADRLALAMEARCYRSNSERTRYRILAFTTADIVAVTLVIIFSGLAIGVGEI